jgi:hypothetical protein
VNLRTDGGLRGVQPFSRLGESSALCNRHETSKQLGVKNKKILMKIAVEVRFLYSSAFLANTIGDICWTK